MKKKASPFKGLKLNIKFTIVMVITIALTMAVLAGVLFYEQEQNVINESINYMEHKQERNADQISTCIDSINMSTQFFLADEEMGEVLNAAAAGRELSLTEIVKFKENDIKNLDRLVSNNPLLYSVRIYASSDDIFEVMPVLYKGSRMNNMEWAGEGAQGWYFGYRDTAFSALITSHKETLAGLVTPITDYRIGEVGKIEAAVTMETLFPALYEDEDSEFGCFVTDEGIAHFGSNAGEDSEAIINHLRESGRFEGNGDITEYHIFGKKKLIVSTLYNRKLGGTLIGVLDISAGIRRVNNTRNFFVGVMVLVLVLLAFLIDRIVKRMLRQFYVILSGMSEVKHGNLDVRIEECSDDEMGVLGKSLNDMLDRIQRLMQENIDREILVKNSEIRALQNQINAHFIYNVLESIKMMAEIDEKYAISDAITSLGKLLRYSMRRVSGNVTVGDELAYIQDYISLINLRYDYPIHLGIKVPEDIKINEIPKMSLQPLVENAILHGIEPLGVESTVYIKAWTEEDVCIVEVSDSGRGMSEEELAALIARIEGVAEIDGGRGNGIGLKNVHDRIVMAFGKQYGLTVYSKPGLYTKVAIRIPVKRVSKKVI